jgi:hypothetical protein
MDSLFLCVHTCIEQHHVETHICHKTLESKRVDALQAPQRTVGNFRSWGHSPVSCTTVFRSQGI